MVQPNSKNMLGLQMAITGSRNGPFDTSMPAKAKPIARPMIAQSVVYAAGVIVEPSPGLNKWRYVARPAYTSRPAKKYIIILAVMVNGASSDEYTLVASINSVRTAVNPHTPAISRRRQINSLSQCCLIFILVSPNVSVLGTANLVRRTEQRLVRLLLPKNVPVNESLCIDNHGNA